MWNLNWKRVRQYLPTACLIFDKKILLAWKWSFNAYAKSQATSTFGQVQIRNCSTLRRYEEIMLLTLMTSKPIYWNCTRCPSNQKIHSNIQIYGFNSYLISIWVEIFRNFRVFLSYKSKFLSIFTNFWP